MKKKKVLAAIVVVAVVMLALVFYADKQVSSAAEGRLFSNPDSIPYHRVGLLLGTSRIGRTGFNNPYYFYRIEAAATLLKSKKIKYLVISGDNSRKDYNEPGMMRQDLMAAGVDSTLIFLDYAGFRTFDSVKRLKEVFGQDTVTIISQQFHNERAVYMAGREGISATGFNAQDVGGKLSIRIKIREKMARVKVLIDYWFGKEPKFLGKKIIIPA